MSPFQEIIKRGFDIAFATAGLLLLSPLLLLISLGIKSESPGPIVCRHRRYGLNNAAFEEIEIRAMFSCQENKRFTHRPNKVRETKAFHHLLPPSRTDTLSPLGNLSLEQMISVQ